MFGNVKEEGVWELDKTKLCLVWWRLAKTKKKAGFQTCCKVGKCFKEKYTRVLENFSFLFLIKDPCISKCLSFCLSLPLPSLCGRLQNIKKYSLWKCYLMVTIVVIYVRTYVYIYEYKYILLQTYLQFVFVCQIQ